MNRSVCIPALVFLLLHSVAGAVPDYSELQTAAKDYAAELARVQGETSSSADAAGTAKIIDEWTAANNALADKFKAFAVKYPETMQGGMPPGMHLIKDKIERLRFVRNDLSVFAAKIEKLYDHDQGIDAAMARLRASKERVDNVGQPDALESGPRIMDAAILTDGQGGSSSGGPTPVETPEAVAQWKKAAEQGDAEAAARLGRCYYYGAGVPVDLHEALVWYEKAAAKGDVEGLLMTANAYERGKGTGQDIPAAVKWYRAAADKGVLLAGTELGIIYMMGKGVPRDAEQGIELLQKSAKAGEKHAENALACCYFNGDGVAVDPFAGTAFMRRSAEDGLAIAEYAYGNMILQYPKRMSKTPDEAREESASWLKKAAEQGVPEGQFSYGLMCSQGTGPKLDTAEGARWFHAAALQGFQRGENAYGYAVAAGKGADVDLAEAYKWYTLALSQRVDEDAGNTAQVNMDALLPVISAAEIQEGKDRAAHFVPVPERHQPNDIIAASEEMKQKSAPAAGTPPAQ